MSSQVTDLLIKFIFLVFAKIRTSLLLFIIGLIVDSETCLQKETRLIVGRETSLIRIVAYSAHR